MCKSLMDSVPLYKKSPQVELPFSETHDFLDHEIITSSMTKMSLDDTSKTLTAFEKKYDDMRSKHDAEVSFFTSRMYSIDSPSIFHEYFNSKPNKYSGSDCSDFTKDEIACLSRCFMIKDSASSIVEMFDKRKEKDRKGHLSLQVLLETIQNDREAMQKDISDLKVANSEQVYNLQKGFVHNSKILNFSKISSLQNLRSNYQPNALKIKNRSSTHILQNEVAELEGEKSHLTKSMHELVQKKTDYQNKIRQLKKGIRRDVEEQRVAIRSLELRNLDAKQKSVHLEEANAKLDEVCKTLASTIETTKVQLDSFRHNLSEIRKEHVDDAVR